VKFGPLPRRGAEVDGPERVIGRGAVGEGGPIRGRVLRGKSAIPEVAVADPPGEPPDAAVVVLIPVGRDQVVDLV
jgi:hypothetical protein